jgi:hypothetical protein
MSEIEAGAICPLAMVESHPIRVEKEQVTIYVRYRRKNTIFPVKAFKDSQYFELLSKLRPGDQMYVSSDGEDITEVIKNPLWKRLWLQMIWSL